ncbi:acyl-CoA thioesterase [Rhodococcus jostii]|uniref:acyl-CoA thioesterase n=1 Tax=Rhodococcus jostii TaxID=132919 RepID=UPI0036670EF2
MDSVEEVVRLLHVESVDVDRFRGKQPKGGAIRVFGGQAVAQALMSACRTVDHRLPHSLHAYFLRAGDVTVPMRYDVERIRDGRRFSVRRVVASQNRKEILAATISFADRLPGIDYQDSPPVGASDPDSLMSIEQQLAPYADEHDGWWVRKRPFDLRYVSDPPRIVLENGGTAEPSSSLYLRARGSVPSSPDLALGLLAYVSDMTLLDSAAKMTGQTSRGPGTIASLDHAIWFHRIPNLAEWILYEQHSPTGCGGRSLVQGRMYSAAGELLCTVAQEGLLDPRT